MTHEAAEIAKLAESASGPDRQMDERIHCAINTLPWSAFYPEWREAMGDVPRYTASLDAAMSLVPDGFMWRLQSWPDGVNSALLEKNAGDFGAIDARHTETFAATPALALTAAALRARAILSEKGEQK